MKTTKSKKRPRSETDEGKRSVHNSLERQRRVDLRNSFDYLRKLVPAIEKLEKSPKVQILRKSTEYIVELEAFDKSYKESKAQLTSSYSMLMSQMKRLDPKFNAENFKLQFERQTKMQRS